MKEIVVNKTKSFTVPAGATSVTITHEWGEVEATATGLTPGDAYLFTPNSLGVYKVAWNTGTDFYESALPLVSSSDFFAEHEDLELEDERFVATERAVRKLIETITGQKFGPYSGKTLRLQGDGGDTLEIPVRIRSVDLVTDQWEDDLTDVIEIAAGEPFFLQYKDRFRAPFYQDYKRDLSVERRKQDFFTDKLDFSITGDFGWEWVPSEVVEAAKLLIVDTLNGSNDLRERGINEAQLGDFSYKLNADQWGTTGNTRADVLLSNYVIMRFGNI